MKCTKCGAELSGKFCTVCGTPAPQQEMPQPVAEPIQYNPAPQQETPQPTAEPMQYNPAPQQEAPQPVVEPAQYNPEPQQEVSQPIVEPAQYNPVPQQTQQPAQQYVSPTQGRDFSQQYQNRYGSNPVNQGGYTGQQYTNQPNNVTAPQQKKSISTGKIVALVLGIVGGVFLLLCIIIGVVACNVVNTVGDIADNTYDIIDDYYDYYYDYGYDLDDFMSNENVEADTENMITCGGEYRFVD